jgi:CHAD domain-containing protein
MAAVVKAPRTWGLVLSPEDAADVAARAVVRHHLRAFTESEERARAGEVEPIHQLRVATRRLRATLRLFEPVLPVRLAVRGQAELAWLGSAIGPVRDADVLSQLVLERAERLDSELRALLGPLGIAIHERRVAAHESLIVALDSSRCRHILDRLAAYAVSAAPRRRTVRLGDIAPDLLRPLLRSVLRSGRRLSADSSPPAFHRLRVRVKRLRYAVETVGGLGGKSMRKLLRQLVRLQDLLGEHQDAVTIAARLHALAEEAGLPRPAVLATGALVLDFVRRGRKLRRRFPEAWQRLDRRRLRDGVAAELRASALRRVAPPRLRATGT